MPTNESDNDGVSESDNDGVVPANESDNEGLAPANEPEEPKDEPKEPKDEPEEPKDEPSGPTNPIPRFMVEFKRGAHFELTTDYKEATPRKDAKWGTLMTAFGLRPHGLVHALRELGFDSVAFRGVRATQHRETKEWIILL